MKQNSKIWKVLTFFTLCLVLFSGCADMFQGQLSLDPTTGTLGDLLKDYSVKVALIPPTQLFASKGSSTTEIYINWNTVEGAASYELWRAVVSKDDAGNWTAPNEEDYECIDNFVYNTGYTDTILSDPTALSAEYQNLYFYKVVSCNIGKRLDASEMSTAVYGSLLAAPIEVSASLGSSYDSIRVEWKAISNTSRYEIYRTRDSSGLGREKIASVNANVTWYNDSITTANQGIEFFYSIKSVNAYNTSSVYSPLAMGFSLKDGAPGTPTAVSATRGTSNSEITVSWTGAGGDSFAIYRASSLNKTELVKVGQTASTTITDTKSLQENVYYYYQVQAIGTDSNNQEVKSAFSESGAKATTPAEGYILSSPSNFVASKQTNGQIQLSWDAGLGSEAEQANYTYSLYQCSTIDGSYSLLTSGITTTSYTDSAGYEYYKISTSGNSIESPLSTPVAPAPLAAKNISVTRYANLGSTYSANDSGVYPVKITWDAPSGGATGGYYVYRSTKADSGFRKITENPVASTSYVDENEVAKAGTYYYYKVLSLNSLSQGANYTDSMYGYGALSADQYFLEYDKTIVLSHKHLTYINKSGDLDKLGTETKSGDISGTVYYSAATSGLGARIIMEYTNYADLYINDNPDLGRYFVVNGNTNTTAKMDSSGMMDGTVTIRGMYPGTIVYNNLEIKGGDAGGGYYVVTQSGFSSSNVSYSINK